MVKVHRGVVTDELYSNSQGLNREVQARRRDDKKISYAIDHSMYKTRIVPKFGQKLLSLSTCMGSNRDDRLLVIGVKQ
ncbi:MAG: hypothetical protein VZQ55_06465 [Ruminococcus sp.]|nr:hypothetical protein [Ruminococcus sp.]